MSAPLTHRRSFLTLPLIGGTFALIGSIGAKASSGPSDLEAACT